MLLREDSGGAGKQRGGLGLQREVRLLTPEAQLSVLSDKNVIPPYGVRFGGSGGRNRFTVFREGKEIEPSALPGKVTGFQLRADDVVIERTAGGGGYGDPLERESHSIARDVRFGYVTPEKAGSVYGLVLKGDAVDEAETTLKRARLRTAKPSLHLQTLHGDEYRGSQRIVEVAPDTAQRLGVAEGDLVEFPSADGPSLLAWVRIDVELAADACRIGPSGLSMLGRAPGDKVELRPIPART